jgi:hypothetical protein
MMYRHLCILGCMHCVSYASCRKASPMYIVHHDLLYMILWASLVWYGLVWLSSWWSWFISMVDGYVFEKCHMYDLLWVNAFIWSWHVSVVFLGLICDWIAYFEHMGPKAHLSSWMFSSHALSYGGAYVLFVTKTFHVPNMNLKMKCKLLGKCVPMSYVLNLLAFGC